MEQDLKDIDCARKTTLGSVYAVETRWRGPRPTPGELQICLVADLPCEELVAFGAKL